MQAEKGRASRIPNRQPQSSRCNFDTGAGYNPPGRASNQPQAHAMAKVTGGHAANGEAKEKQKQKKPKKTKRETQSKREAKEKQKSSKREAETKRSKSQEKHKEAREKQRRSEGEAKASQRPEGGGFSLGQDALKRPTKTTTHRENPPKASGFSLGQDALKRPTKTTTLREFRGARCPKKQRRSKSLREAKEEPKSTEKQRRSQRSEVGVRSMQHQCAI